MIRITALLAATAVAVHELVYLVLNGGDVARVLSHAGHPQLAALTPAVALLLAVALGRLIILLLRARFPTAPGSAVVSRWGLWSAASASLIFIFVVQVSLETVVVSGGTGDLHASQYASWAVLAAVLGAALLPLLRDPRTGVPAGWWQPDAEPLHPSGTRPNDGGRQRFPPGPSSLGRLELDGLRTSQVSFAAALHERELAEGLFPRLGRGFLRVYYRSFIASPHAAALVARCDGRPVGVLVGTVRNRAHYGWVVRRRGLRLAVAATLALATRPRLALHFARTRTARYWQAVMRHSRSGAGRGGTEPSRDVAVLTHLSVSREARGLGVGRTLLGAFVGKASREGAREAHLVTAAGQDGAGGFYAASGWRHDGDRVNHEGDPISAYSLRIGPDS